MRIHEPPARQSAAPQTAAAGRIPAASGPTTVAPAPARLGHDFGRVLVLQRKTGDDDSAPAASPGSRLPFESTEAARGGWDAAAILSTLGIDADSPAGKTITAGPAGVGAMNKRSSEQADQDAQSPGISIHMKAALLAAHWEPIRVSIALVLREATYGDLMTAVALNEIMSKRCAEKISQLMRWSAAVQSKDPAAAFAARTTPPAEFSAEYDDPKKDEPRYNPKNDPEQIETGFESNIGEIKATSQGGLQRPTGPAKTGGGTPAASEISFTALKEIYRKMGEDVAADPEKEKKALRYLAYLNQAFRVMKIDTVEAQAVYLAHAFIESDQFRQFTETQGSKAVKEGKQKWEDDPQKIELDVRDLAARYKLGGTVNPHGEYEFLGRGPVQVTHRRGYIEVIATLEKMAEQYEVEGDAGNLQSCEFAALARDAANAVKADPKNAADPRYTFLVSAALMKSRRADAAVAYTRPTPGVAWTGVDAPSAWVAGGEQAPGSPQAEALLAKSNAYAQIYPILLREARPTP